MEQIYLLLYCKRWNYMWLFANRYLLMNKSTIVVTTYYCDVTMVISWSYLFILIMPGASHKVHPIGKLRYKKCLFANIKPSFQTKSFSSKRQAFCCNVCSSWLIIEDNVKSSILLVLPVSTLLVHEEKVTNTDYHKVLLMKALLLVLNFQHVWVQASSVITKESKIKNLLCYH
jgi:hypothetical protein